MSMIVLCASDPMVLTLSEVRICAWRTIKEAQKLKWTGFM